MKMPNINISFSEKSQTAIKRSERGIVALILRGTVPQENPVTIFTNADVPEVATMVNKKQINLALMGYQSAPKKVIAYFITQDAENYTDALTFFKTERFDYLAVPTVETDGKTQEIATWIKEQRTEGKKCKAVLPNTEADSEGVINFATPELTENNTKYKTEEYCSRIAGIIAGTPLNISCTYAPLPELTDCTRMTVMEMDSAIGTGKFIVVHDGEKVKIGRGINSLTTTSDVKGYQFRKIKIVEAIDMINDDIKKTAEDNFLGKFANNYDNKCLLISAIQNYFEELQMNGILSYAKTEIDIKSQKDYLKANGVRVEELTDEQIKVADTSDKVFLKATIKILDAIEEIELPIAI